MEEQIIHVEGMFCGHCEIAVQDAIRKLPGIKKVKASKRKKQAIVAYSPQEVSLEEIKQSVRNTGYDVV